MICVRDIWRAFGSRVNRVAKPHSDCDLVVMTHKPLPAKLMWEIKAQFEESDLPFRVDVLDWADLNEDFRNVILANCEIIQHSK